jgi:hypothetical protein
MQQSKTDKSKVEIGSAEFIEIPTISEQKLPARIDTGARTSAIWVSSVRVTEEGLEVIFFGKKSSLYTGRSVIFQEYDTTVVGSSNGQTEQRYKVKMLIKVLGRSIKASFTLTDRSSQVYPILIGRNVLRGKFIVDVSSGKRLIEAEKARTAELKAKQGAL